jgi:oxygen-dependent protoporphyrinogen oxidase
VTQPLAASAIVIATPTGQAARLLAGVQPAFADLLLKIEYAGVAQVSAGYRLAQLTGALGRKPQGFGVLIPRTEGLRLLGAVFNSFLFAGRAPDQPEKMASFTSFFGGATDPAICKRPENTLAEIARTELAHVLGITGLPVAEHVTRWERALPQYNLGHERIVAGLKKLCVETPGVFLAGNYLSGPSLGACIDQANVTAADVARFLRL